MVSKFYFFLAESVNCHIAKTPERHYNHVRVKRKRGDGIMIIKTLGNGTPRTIKGQHGGFTSLHEFANYVRRQQELGNFWDVSVITLSPTTSLVVYTRDHTKVLFDVESGRLISYNDNHYEMTDEPKKEAPA